MGADNLCVEMNDLMHDYEVMSRISDLVAQLKGKYEVSKNLPISNILILFILDFIRVQIKVF